MQIGDLVERLGQIGIILQIDSQGHLVQIKWFDARADAYWYHPSNLEVLCKSET